jgi:2-phospho-L-lactate transferase/gluconeogenesis factor (CofD/UPF0052 family)
MNIVTLAGGVGGAKLAQGLTLTPPHSLEGSGSLTVIVNTARSGYGDLHIGWIG